MSESSIADPKKLLAEVLDKVTAVEDEVSSLKVNQAHLHVAVNNVQSLHLEQSESSTNSANGKSLANDTSAPLAASHKLHFLKFDSSADPIAWLHHSEPYSCTPHAPPKERRYGWLPSNSTMQLNNCTIVWSTAKESQFGCTLSSLLAFVSSSRHAATSYANSSMFAEQGPLPSTRTASSHIWLAMTT